MYHHLRLEKRKRETLKSILQEILRELNAYKNLVNTQKSHLNYSLIDQKSSSKEIQNAIITQIQEKTGKSKLRKNGVVACDLVLGATSEFFKGKSPDEIRQFFEGALDWCKDRFGAEYIHAAVVHMDETSPHMHLVFTPFKISGKETTKLQAGDVITKKFLHDLQVEFYEGYTKKLGLQAPQTGKEYVDLARYKVQAAEEKLMTLKKEIVQRSKTVNELVQYEKELNRNVVNLQQQQTHREELTFDSMERQLNALNLYDDITIKHTKKYQDKSGAWKRTMIEKKYKDRGDLKKDVANLIRHNAYGEDIYLDPPRQHPYIVLDDLTRDGLNLLQDLGYEPCCIVETSPSNYQAWVKIQQDPLPDEEQAEISKLLQQASGADPAAVGKHRLGRLAGYLNCKPKHRTDQGTYPAVRCKYGYNAICSKAEDLLTQARAMIAARAHKQSQTTYQERARIVISDETTIGSTYYAQWLQRSRKLKSDGSPDWSVADYAVACRMAQEGHGEDQIRTVILQHSPNIQCRKSDPVMYATHTAAKAMEQIEQEDQHQHHLRRA